MSAIMRKKYKDCYTKSRMIRAFDNMVKSSFRRDNYIIPRDYLNILDQKMCSLILKKPDIDFQFYGMGGICAFLWYRIESLRAKKDIWSKEQFYDLQKFLLFYVDWIDDVLKHSDEREEICSQLPAVFSKMLEKHFYTTKTQKVLNSLLHHPSENNGMATERDIIENAIKIYNCSI